MFAATHKPVQSDTQNRQYKSEKSSYPLSLKPLQAQIVDMVINLANTDRDDSYIGALKALQLDEPEQLLSILRISPPYFNKSATAQVIAEKFYQYAESINAALKAKCWEHQPYLPLILTFMLKTNNAFNPSIAYEAFKTSLGFNDHDATILSNQALYTIADAANKNHYFDANLLSDKISIMQKSCQEVINTSKENYTISANKC
ncbi:hypothetical protein OAT84_02180 [Gammaproteobacteria bacterium]|nr:hypothetical protein [Gammaproteobacteria bacterium]